MPQANGMVQDPSGYELRYVGNYRDLAFGHGYHPQPIPFHEFLVKPESMFMYEDNFMQIPGDVQSSAEIAPIEETARLYVVNYIMDHFENELLSLQDYAHWATLFRHKCDSVCPGFWAQVNMINLMLAKDLEMDQNDIERSNTGSGMLTGGQTVTTDAEGTSATHGTVENVQDVTNTQTSDSSSRDATATTLPAEGIVSDGIDYDWRTAADAVHETRSRQGDSKQHIEGNTTSDSTTESNNHSVSTTAMNNQENITRGTQNEKQNLTNKMFMQEKQWAINTARDLLPLDWLAQQLAPCFYQLY
jgi:hypothetical protein